MQKEKAFGLWSAVFLGIGSMVGAGIFVLLGEAGAIAGNLVWLSFILGGLIALLSGYSLAKLAETFPSRGGIVEYLVQCYGEGVFSGSVSVLFYLSAIVALAMVTKTFGTYASMMLPAHNEDYADIFALIILCCFVVINLAGSTLIARSENVIVIFKLSIILIFTVAVSFYIHTDYLSLKNAPPVLNVFSAIALTFFAYEGFRVITNTAEDMANPAKLMMKAMMLAIGLVMALYVAVTFAVFGNLTLDEIIAAQDYALAEAAKPVFGEVGFVLMAVAALISTASSINANLYAVTNVTYDMAKNGELPEEYKRNVYHSTEGLLISATLIAFLILFFELKEIAAIGSISMLFVHALVHTGHLFKHKQTGASTTLLILAIISMLAAIGLALHYTNQHIPGVGEYVALGFLLAFMIEVLLRLFTHRTIKPQIKINFPYSLRLRK